MKWGIDDIRAQVVHRYAWLWESLEGDPGFLIRAMFGSKAVYLDGRLMLCFMAKDEPWRGVLICTERVHHESLRADFPALVNHPVLPKWLYLAEAADSFEHDGERLVRLAARRDTRIGIDPKPRRRKKGSARSRKNPAAGRTKKKAGETNPRPSPKLARSKPG